MMEEDIAIGIDLGTTNSCVAVLKDGIAEVIPNEFGQRTTPSMVTICADGIRLVGQEAKNNQYRNLKNTIYESKRLIGRKFNEACVQDRMLHWPFKIIEESNGNPKISVTILSPSKMKKTFYPEEISAMILEKMKTVAENYLKRTITKVVITVPAYFNDNQRQATIDAGKLAKLEVQKIINEPTAATFTYILKNNITESCNSLVFDLGGGTFDVSIIHSHNNEFTVLAVNGDPDLGGADFDVLLYNDVVNIIQKQFNSKVTFTEKQRRRIMANCIRVKEQLSEAMQAHFDLPNLVEDRDFEYTYEREAFEKLISHLIKKILSIVRSTLKDANKTVNDIDNIVLVGGSSRIPIIVQNLENMFKKDVSQAVNPDEAVACGAAYQAAILSNAQDAVLTKAVVVDVTPFSLGIETEGQYMDVIIKKNTRLPASFIKKYTTIVDNQKALRIIVYQGEDKFTKNNTKLGYFDLTGIPPLPARVPKILVQFDINTNGILHVTATGTSSNETMQVQIITNTGRISEDDFNRIDRENSDYKTKQNFMNKSANEKDTLLRDCFNMKRTVTDINNLNDEKKIDLINEIETIINEIENLSVTDEHSIMEIKKYKRRIKTDYGHFNS